MSTPTDLAYGCATTVDGEWGCCHGEEDLRGGGRGPDYDGDEFEPLPSDCLGAKILAEWLPLLADHDAALIAKAKAEGAVEALSAAADWVGACPCDKGPTSDGPERECPVDGEEAARFYVGQTLDYLRDRSLAIAAGIAS